MIPIRLELKNFMSYGEQVAPLDFNGMHLACLSGENGNGKSAILDAITWVLWGEARASSDELIRLGSDEMRVVLDFELNGDIYRVIRGRSKRNAGNVWELYISDGPDNYRPITGQGIRDTGKTIQRILRMDYKTFINSAYIQQGRADEFTKQTVADRKKILGDILDLSRYDVLEQKAKERRNEADLRLTELDREITQKEAELSGEDTWRAQIEETKLEQVALESGIAETEKAIQTLNARQAELEASARSAQEMQRQLSTWQQEISNLQSQKSEQERRISNSREIINDRQRIIDGADNLRITRETIAVLDKRLEELRSLENEKSRTGMKIAEEKHRLELEQRTFANQLAEMESKIDGAAVIAKDAEILKEQVAELDKLDTRKSELQSTIENIASRMGEMKQMNELLKEQKLDLQSKQKLIMEPGAKCPLCLTELGEEKHANIIDEYAKMISDTDSQINRLWKEANDIKAKRDAVQKEIDEINARLRSGQAIRDRIAQANQKIFDAEKYREQVPGIQAKLKSIADKLSSENFAAELRSAVKAIESKVTALNYSEDEHRRMKTGLPELLVFETLAVKLKHAEETLASDETNLHTITELIAARDASITKCRSAIEGLSASLQELQTVSSELKVQSVKIQELRNMDRLLAGRIATLEQSLLKCEQLRVEISAKRKDLEKTKKDKSIYTDLVAAFGKKGVQALIIENAIPEIQEEANRLLARMTDNAMQVSIETVRDKKTGGTAETLDIRISDDMGTRSYELYSGGEAFRVNFALRIALSKLLARRAGARLQTLIIDEGFGTQDGKGREKLVDAIASIRDDFERILVITHIDELKDAFPTRIEITKDSMGSQISIN
ncbi:MAG: AAA family ATPase [Armatimonadota bacterium]